MCLTPVTVRRQIANHFYMNNVPCGKCLECIKDKQNEYIVRAIEEQRKRGSMVFFTLTYSPEALPVTEDYEIDEESGEILDSKEVQTLCRKDVMMWKHTFEKYYKRKGKKLDYGFLICGEYGTRTQRPHYHGMFFGLEQDVVNDIMWRWREKYGFVVFKFIPPLMSDIEKVARYCSKYICKDENWNNLPNDKCEKPRKMTSKFFGMPEPARWKKMVNYYTCQDIVKYDIDNLSNLTRDEMRRLGFEIIKRRKYRLGNGKEFKLPNYYKRKIFYAEEKLTGKVRATEVQRMVTYHVQREYDKLFKEELHNLATIYDLGTYAQAVDKYNVVHDNDKECRKARYAENNTKYYVRSVY